MRLVRADGRGRVTLRRLGPLAAKYSVAVDERGVIALTPAEEVRQ